MPTVPRKSTWYLKDDKPKNIFDELRDAQIDKSVKLEQPKRVIVTVSPRNRGVRLNLGPKTR